MTMMTMTTMTTTMIGKEDWMVQRKVRFSRGHADVEGRGSCCFGTRMPDVDSWEWDLHVGV
jgi:hypothetical protein